MKELQESFARQIRELRQNKHLTQSELAGKIGLSRQSIYSIETGRCLPSLDIALDLIKFFDRTFDDIFTEEFFDDKFETPIPLINIKQTEKEMIVSIPLSENIDANKAKAEIKDGTLIVSIPKKALAKPKAVKVKIKPRG